MDNENAFTQDDIDFIAQDGEECAGCYFDSNGCVCVAHPCAPTKRADSRSIIWVVKNGR